MAPKARSEGLIIKELDGELAIYDEREHRAHELNQTASTVWQKCDGQTPLEQIAAEIAAESDLPQDEGIVELAIDQLFRAGLLEGAAANAQVSRRQLISRLGLAGTAALLLPAVTTIVAPTRAMAQSGPPVPVPVPVPPMMDVPTPGFAAPTPRYAAPTPR